MWDVFISHASEDKDNFVRPLAKHLLEVYHVQVWYDELSLEYGDSLLSSIEKGMQDSKYGVVVLSKSFFDKTWTDHEFISLRTKEMSLNEKIIIPIWYNVTKKEVSDYSLALSDKVAIQASDGFNIDEITIKLIKIIRPDIFQNIGRMQTIEKVIKASEKSYINVDDFEMLPTPPVRHKFITTQMKARLKLIHTCIKDVDTRTYEQYEEDFRRNVNIDREMIITELLTAAYLDCISVRDMTSTEKLFIYILTIQLGKEANNLPFSQEELNAFVTIINHYLLNKDAAMTLEYKFDLNEDDE